MTKSLTCLLFFTFVYHLCFGQADCDHAVPLTQLANNCASYTTTAAMPVYWFKFTATKYNVSIKVNSQTLTNPDIGLFLSCNGTGIVGNTSGTANSAQYDKGGLIIGNTYYIEVTSTTAHPGTFQLCINNFNPIAQPGQDCATATILCSTQSFSQFNVSGPGNNPDEAKGTCLDGGGTNSEQNSAWYKWQAANNGTLVFTITPDHTNDDIDYVLFDLGATGDCTNATPANAIRCSAGHGICSFGPNYYKTGLDFASTDLSEPTGCGLGQDGKTKYITMQQGHYYALLINDFSSSNNGFTVDFKDQNGLAGTGQFTGSKSVINYSVLDTCAGKQTFSFVSKSINYATLKWDFGIDANITSATDAGPYTISYSTPGTKTVTVQSATAQGCIDVDFATFTVKPFPPKVTISVNKPKFCINDTIVLTINRQPGYTYQWSGPDNFSDTSANVSIPVSGKKKAGTYTVTEIQSPCVADIEDVTIPPILSLPEASFYTVPPLHAFLSTPIDIHFYNRSTNADSYFWEFGDGGTSTDTNPTHRYTQNGTYQVKLTAFNQQVCSTSVLVGDYVILDGNTLYIPNTFTPNGDGVNDFFRPQVTNISIYHIYIYNRWGQLVYESKDMSTGWDGSFSNEAMPVGVYYYMIDARGYFGETVRRSGYVTLLR